MINKERYYHDDEINLEDILRIIIKRKWLICSIIALSLFLGIVFRLIMPPVYESRSIIKIGQIMDKYLEDPLVLIEKIKQKYQNDKIKKLPFLDSISLGNNSRNLLFFVAKGKTPKEARDFLKKIISAIIKEHQHEFEAGIGFQKTRYNFLLSQIGQIKNEIILFDKRIKQASNRDNILTYIYILEKVELSKQLTDLDNQLADVRFILSDINSNNSEVIQEPTLMENPVGLSFIQYLILLIFLGIILGIGSIFFVDFFQNFKLNISSSGKTSEYNL